MHIWINSNCWEMDAAIWRLLFWNCSCYLIFIKKTKCRIFFLEVYLKNIICQLAKSAFQKLQYMNTKKHHQQKTLTTFSCLTNLGMRGLLTLMLDNYQLTFVIFFCIFNFLAANFVLVFFLMKNLGVIAQTGATHFVV